jgi:RNA polymerase sigma-70 factor (ECF subfamily)
MFFSVVIPGILSARDVRAEIAETQEQERAHASMTAKNHPDSQGAQHVGAEACPWPPASSGEAANTEEGTRDAPSYTVVQLYEQFRRPIHSYIYRLLGNQDDADDVTQEVFIRAFSAWDSLYDRENLSAWLYRIATNLCVDLLRRRKRIAWWPLGRRSRDEAVESGVDEDAGVLPPDSGGIPEIAEREHIRLALARMPEEYAVVLVLSAAQGVPYQEIAAIVGISPNAAATRISRAKKMFMEQYQRLNREGLEKTEEER